MLSDEAGSVIRRSSEKIRKSCGNKWLVWRIYTIVAATTPRLAGCSLKTWWMIGSWKFAFRAKEALNRR